MVARSRRELVHVSSEPVDRARVAPRGRPHRASATPPSTATTGAPYPAPGTPRKCLSLIHLPRVSWRAVPLVYPRAPCNASSPCNPSPSHSPASLHVPFSIRFPLAPRRFQILPSNSLSSPRECKNAGPRHARTSLPPFPHRQINQNASRWPRARNAASNTHSDAPALARKSERLLGRRRYPRPRVSAESRRRHVRHRLHLKHLRLRHALRLEHHRLRHRLRLEHLRLLYHLRL